MRSEIDLEREFLSHGLRRSDFLDRNDAKMANLEFDRLHELKDELRKLPDRGAAALKRIARSGDLRVRTTAAAALLAIDEEYALAILADVASQDAGLISFTAEMTASEWRAGQLRDYWS